MALPVIFTGTEPEIDRGQVHKWDTVRTQPSVGWSKIDGDRIFIGCPQGFEFRGIR